MAIGKERRLTGTRAAFAGLTALGGTLLGVACNHEGAQNETPRTTPTATLTVKEQDLGTRFETFEEAREVAIDHIAYNYFINESYPKLREDKSQKEMYDIAKERPVTIARFYQQNSQYNLEFVAPISDHTVRINGREYDVNKRTDFVIASALLETLIMEKYELTYELHRPLPSNTFENIERLYGKVEFEETDVPPFVPAEQLSALSKVIQALEATSKPYPKVISLVPDGSTYEQKSDTLALEVSPYSGMIRLYSDIAQWIRTQNESAFWAYQDAIQKTYDESPVPFKEPELIFMYGYSQDQEDDFATTFAEYFLNGVGFRGRIEYAWAKGFQLEAKILEAKYCAWVEFWHGKEFLVDGITATLRDYKIGDVVTIYDYDPQHPGIFLRPQPTLERNPSWPVVYDGAKVRITDGPVLVLDDRTKEAVWEWNVEKGTVWNFPNFFEPGKKNGWIPRNWLGEIVPLKR
jgi:hypothetical protein